MIMNLDDKIKQALKVDAEEIELLMTKEKGLFEQLFAIFKGNRRHWNVFGMILAVLTAITMFWSFYHFILANNLDDRIFWGVISLALWTGNMGLKVWFWLEMNRNSTSREIKRLEIAVAQLTAKLHQS